MCVVRQLKVEIVQRLNARVDGRMGLRISPGASWMVLARLHRSLEQALPPMLVDDLQPNGARMMALPSNFSLGSGVTVFASRAGAAPALRFMAPFP